MEKSTPTDIGEVICVLGNDGETHSVVVVSGGRSASETFNDWVAANTEDDDPGEWDYAVERLQRLGDTESHSVARFSLYRIDTPTDPADPDAIGVRAAVEILVPMPYGDPVVQRFTSPGVWAVNPSDENRVSGLFIEECFILDLMLNAMGIDPTRFDANPANHTTAEQRRLRSYMESQLDI